MAVSIKTPLFLGIAGGSGSGKTTLAHKIRNQANADEVGIIYTDYYYRSQNHLTEIERAKTNYDHPDALEFELLAVHLEQLKHYKTIELPVYNFAEHNRATEIVNFSACPIIIVEGILALHPETLRKFYRKSVFVDTSDQLRFERRLTRDIKERGRTKESVYQQWAETVQPMYLEYCKPSMQYADKIIRSEIITDQMAHEILIECRNNLSC